MSRPGEIYYANMPSGARPAIIVSREELNRGHYVVAVPCTTQKFESRKTLPNYVALYAGDWGLTANCVAQCEHIASISKNLLDMDSGPVGTLDDSTLRDILKAIGYVIGCDCEPL